MAAVTETSRLFQLLPALYRVRDAAQGEPLRALVEVVEAELDRVEGDIGQLYDNWFVETCAEWVVPYLGDLLRVRPIHAVESARVTTRAYVANTLAYRRRKGTVVVLEQLARDTTGWPARAVEFFKLLATTQHLNHVRLDAPVSPSIRNAAIAELTGSPFDVFTHTAEVRRISPARGRYNIPNVGLFLWRAQSYRVECGSARFRMAAAPGAQPYYTFNPLGLDAPLFVYPQTEETITHVASEENVPAVLRRLALDADLALRRQQASATEPRSDQALVRFMSDHHPAFRVFIQLPGATEPQELAREDIYVCEIPDDAELGSPSRLAVAVDPERGRLALPSGVTADRVLVSYTYGFPGDLGGGPYNRSDSIDQVFTRADWQAGVSHPGCGPAIPGMFPSLRAAVAAWNALPPGRTGVIAITDSISEEDLASPSVLEIEIPAGSQLLVVAADWPLEEDPSTGVPTRITGRFEPSGVRSHYIGTIAVRGAAEPGTEGCRLVLNGLLIEGRVEVAGGDLRVLALDHCTLAPQPESLVVYPDNSRLQVRLTRTIAGAIAIEHDIDVVWLVDSIVTGEASGSPAAIVQAPRTSATIERSTIIGGLDVETLNASNSIFTERAMAARRQEGCVRFSYVAPGSAVPRRYRCQPDFEIRRQLAAARDAKGGALDAPAESAIATAVQRWLVPLFESRRVEDPEFAQLARRCPVQIREGADDGSEMGAFSFLHQPQREANLRGVLAEYLRFGLEAGLFFVGVPRRRDRA